MKNKDIKRFSNGKTHINVKTVGQILDELKLLPRSMPIHQGFENSADLVIFNQGQDDMHLSVEDGGNWT